MGSHMSVQEDLIASAEKKKRLFHISEDIHFNKYGYAVIARSIQQFLYNSQNLVPPSAMMHHSVLLKNYDEGRKEYPLNAGHFHDFKNLGTTWCFRSPWLRQSLDIGYNCLKGDPETFAGKNARLASCHPQLTVKIMQYRPRFGGDRVGTPR